MSPLTAAQRARYPKDWREIRTRILARACDRCECAGECGSEHPSRHGLTGPKGVRVLAAPRCGAPHRRHIVRDEPDNPGLWRLAYDACDHECTAECDDGCWHDCEAECAERDSIECVLTIAHLDHDPSNNDPNNLRAMCQRCHLRYDREHHQRNAAATRVRKRGNLDLFTEAP